MSAAAIKNFGPFLLDQQRRALIRGGEVLRIRRQSFDVLLYLIESRERTVAHAEIVSAVWPSPPSNPDQSVTQCVKDIRKALGPDHGWMVRTVPGSGYQFVGDIVQGEAEPSPHLRPDPSLRGDPVIHTPAPVPVARSNDTDATPVAAAPNPAPASIAQPAPRKHRRVAGRAALFLLLTIAAGLTGLWLKPLSAPRSTELTMMAAPTVAVLVGSAENEMLRAGLHPFVDEIAAQLLLVPRGYDLQVRPPSGTLGEAVSLEARANALGVRYLVNVSARAEADRQQVTVQLIEGPTGRQIWSQPFTRLTAGSLPNGEIAPRIAREIAVAIRTAENARPLPARVEAGHLTLQARALIEGERGPEPIRQAKDFLDKAVALDPNSSMALMGSARARVVMVSHGWVPPAERSKLLKEAEGFVARVISIDKSTAGAFVLRGVIERIMNNLDASLAALEHARGLRPDYVLVHAEIGRTLLDLGRPREALASIKKSIAASPNDPALGIWHRWAGMAAAQLSEFQTSLDHLLKARELNRAHVARPLIAIAYLQLGDRARATEVIKEHLSKEPKFNVDGWTRVVSRGNPAIAKRIEPLGQALVDLGVPRTKD